MVMTGLRRMATESLGHHVRQNAKRNAARAIPILGQRVGDFSPKVREHLSKSIHYRRLAVKRLRDPEAVKQLFEQIAERYTERPGGYLRVLKTSERALGDASPRSLLGFVGGEQGPAKQAETTVID